MRFCHNPWLELFLHSPAASAAHAHHAQGVRNPALDDVLPALHAATVSPDCHPLLKYLCVSSLMAFLAWLTLQTRRSRAVWPRSISGWGSENLPSQR